MLALISSAAPRVILRHVRLTESQNHSEEYEPCITAEPRPNTLGHVQKTMSLYSNDHVTCDTIFQHTLEGT